MAEDEGPAEFTVTLSEASTGAVTVEYRTANVTATAGFDYAETSGTLTIAANNTTATIAVEVLNDGDAEGTERFTVELSGASGATIVDGEGVGTITDDDTVVPPPPPPPPPPLLPSLSIGNAIVTEGPTARAEFTVTLSEASGQEVTVDYETSDATALAGSDYTAASGTLTIDSGEMTGTITVEVLDDVVIEGDDETFTVELSGANGATIVDGEGLGTIEDDDAVEPPPELPTLEIGNVTVSEDGGPAEFTVTLSTTSGQAVTVEYATMNVTALAGSDYTAASGTLTIDSGEMTGTITVEVLDDGVIEGDDETFTVELSGASGATIVDGEGLGTIEDDDAVEPPPELPTLEIGNVTVSEDGGPAEFTVTLSTTSGQAVTVEYATMNVTALAGSDYTAASGTLTIDSGEMTGTITVEVLDDGVIEGDDETFTVELSGASGATIVDGEGLGTIEDDDAVEPPPELPTLEIGNVTVSEDGGPAEFTVTLSTTSGQAVTVEYATMNVTALAGSDYTAASGTLTIDSGEMTGTITVEVLDDVVIEGDDETFTVELSGASGATIVDGEGLGTIEDDDAVEPPPELPTLEIGNVTVSEDGGPAEFTVTLSTTSGQAVTVEYATMNVTALAGSDYTAASGTLTIDSGEMTGTITVEVLDDGVIEGDDETFTVELSGANGATIVDGEGLGTIEDDDAVEPPPELPTLEIGNVTVSEDGGPAEFTVTLSTTSGQDVTVEYATMNVTALAGSDYTAASGTVRITAGDSTGTITVAVLDDGVVEGNETFTVELSGASGATIVDGEGVGTIEDDDVEEPPPGQPTLHIGNARVDEDDGPAEFTVTLSETSGDDVTVAYATSDGTAKAGLDYTTVSGTLTIQAGETTGTISVAIRADEVVEEDEAFTVMLSGAVNATIVDGEGRGVIEDDDGTRPPRGHSTLRIDDVTVAEGDGHAVFTVTLSQAGGPGVTVRYRTVDGTATVGSDYAKASRTLKFGAGIRELTISVAVVDDKVVEEDETFAVTLSDARNATIVDGEGVGTIEDDDEVEPPPRVPTLEIDDVTVAEDDGSAEFTVTLNEASADEVTVGYATSDGTARAGQDYTGTTGTLTIAAASRTGTISVLVLDDNHVEEDETFTVTLSNPTGGTIVDGEGVGTIEDDDAEEPPPGVPTLNIGDATVAEAGGSAQFEVTLSEAISDEVTVAYATSDETARAGRDYTASSGTLTIAAGDTTGTISVPVLDDEAVEGDETFTVRLSGASGAAIVDGEGVGTITDDDQAELTVSYGASSYSVTEGSAVSVTVVLSEAPGSSTTIPLTHMPVAGAGASDYSGVPDTVSFASSETQRSFTVSATGDKVRDADEQVVLGFGTLPSGVVPGDPETSTITIVDEPPSTDPNRNPWLRRFGETAAGHLLDALDERIRCAPIRQPVPGRDETAPSRRGCEPRQDDSMTFVVAGHRLPVGPAPTTASGLWHPADRFADAWSPDDWTLEGRDSGELPSLSAKEVLARTTFQMLSRSQGGAERLSLWGRGALSRFSDDDRGSDLDGNVASATFGVDYADDRVLAGIALSHSAGDGSYLRGDLDRDADASLTGFYPYLYVGVNEHVSIWGVAGFGSGTLKLTSNDVGSRTGVGARMGAAGARREILYPSDNQGVSLALKGDAVFLRIDSDETLDLDATRNRASRQRLAMEVSQEFTLKTGEWVAPFFEAGARLDGGDAKTDLGLELSGGFRYEHPLLGLTAEFDTRGLLQDAITDVDELGVSGSLRYDPMTHSTLGPSLALSLSGGIEGWDRSGGLWGHDILADWGTQDGDATDPRIDAEFGYGSPILGGSGTGTPWVGASISEQSRDWRLGYRIGFGSRVNVGIDGRLRQDTAGEGSSDYAVILRLSIR